MVENSNLGADSKQGESTSRKGEGERGDVLCWKKGEDPSLYRTREGVPPHPLPHVGLNPQGGECAGLGGGSGPLTWRQAQGGNSPPPLMGPIGPYSPFPFLIILIY